MAHRAFALKHHEARCIGQQGLVPCRTAYRETYPRRVRSLGSVVQLTTDLHSARLPIGTKVQAGNSDGRGKQKLNRQQNAAVVKRASGAEAHRLVTMRRLRKNDSIDALVI